MNQNGTAPMRHMMTIPGENLHEALRRRRLTWGSWIQTGSPAAVEILANAGYDWLGIDCEHTAISVADVEHFCRARAGRGTALLVRVRCAEPLAIRQALDVGADGVIVPMVESRDEAEAIVAAAKYPPHGRRGYCFGRMNDWGTAFDDYAHKANESVSVIAMIETKRGVENVEGILAVDGIDGVFIGPYDLSGSYGVPGQTGHVLVRDARRRVLMACAAAGKTAGLHIVNSSPEQIETAVTEGFTFICLDADIIHLNRSGQEVLEQGRQAADRASIQKSEGLKRKP